MKKLILVIIVLLLSGCSDDNLRKVLRKMYTECEGDVVTTVRAGQFADSFEVQCMKSPKKWAED